jgi:xanthine dehydrogenase iron-sulfur cluster and FAD-binding subunit A
MWQDYIIASNLEEVVQILAENNERARVVAGATDLLLELERGVRNDIDILIDITRIPDLDQISLDDLGVIHLGPLVTHNYCVASKLLRESALPLVEASWQVGAPQIRNRGTIAGNLITASPANDTIGPLVALGGSVTLRSVRGDRVVPLDEFYTGVRSTVMQSDEIMVDISFKAMSPHRRGTFRKLGLRNAQAISVVNVSIILELEEDRRVKECAITLGAVAPTIIHAPAAEEFLVGRVLDDKIIHEASNLVMNASRPISDVRGSAAYRREMVRVLSSRGLQHLANGHQSPMLPEDPILLQCEEHPRQSLPIESLGGNVRDMIMTTKVNGKEYSFSNVNHKTLLDLLRDEFGLIGTKEGCAEGECGACTVILDGLAVMSCLVPAPRAHGADIVTIEGLSQDNQLHAVQQAFINDGAVQCGYCTPGFIMSAAVLLEEREHPTRDDIKQAITGNLCRCTGYYKIIDAIEHASKEER